MQGSGISFADGVLGVHDTTISQTRLGIMLEASMYSFGGLVLTNNSFGISSTRGLVELIGSATITNNTDTGIHLEASSTAIIGSATINNNGTGISVIGNSYLDLAGGEVKSNTRGLFSDLFGKAYSGRGTSATTPATRRRAGVVNSSSSLKMVLSG